MNFRMHSTPVVALLIMASLGTKAQTSLPPWEHDNNFSSTIHNMYQIDDDNFDGTTYGHNYATWLLFGRVAASRYVSNSGNGYDNSPKRIGFVSTEDTYIDWYPGANKRVGSKQFESMNFGFISSSNAYIMSARSRTNIMTLTKDEKVGIGTTSPSYKLDVVGRCRFRAGKNSSGVSTGTAGFWLNNEDKNDKVFMGMLDNDKVGIWSSSNNVGWNLVMNAENGNVGIGTSVPNDKLHLLTTATRTSAGNPITYTGRKPEITTSLQVTNTQDNSSSNYEGQIGISLYGDRSRSASSTYPFFEIETHQPNVPIIMEVNDKATMQIFQNQVLIGSDLPFPSSDAVIPFSGTNYTLGVRGNILSSGVTCKDLSKWADYVFDDHYKLKPLNEVETYIAQNKHLPDVPSEEEVKKNGVDLVEMLKVHMQKIEELTLYTIEQQKLLKEQQRQINELKQQLAVPRQ